MFELLYILLTSITGRFIHVVNTSVFMCLCIQALPLTAVSDTALQTCWCNQNTQQTLISIRQLTKTNCSFLLGFKQLDRNSTFHSRFKQGSASVCYDNSVWQCSLNSLIGGWSFINTSTLITLNFTPTCTQAMVSIGLTRMWLTPRQFNQGTSENKILILPCYPQVW